MERKDTFEISDNVIEKAYPDIFKKGLGWWGHKRIPNWGILRGAIEQAVREERNHETTQSHI